MSVFEENNFVEWFVDETDSFGFLKFDESSNAIGSMFVEPHVFAPVRETYNGITAVDVDEDAKSIQSQLPKFLVGKRRYGSPFTLINPKFRGAKSKLGGGETFIDRTNEIAIRSHLSVDGYVIDEETAKSCEYWLSVAGQDLWIKNGTFAIQDYRFASDQNTKDQKKSSVSYQSIPDAVFNIPNGKLIIERVPQLTIHKADIGVLPEVSLTEKSNFHFVFDEEVGIEDFAAEIIPAIQFMIFSATSGKSSGEIRRFQMKVPDELKPRLHEALEKVAPPKSDEEKEKEKNSVYRMDINFSSGIHADTTSKENALDSNLLHCMSDFEDANRVANIFDFYKSHHYAVRHYWSLIQSQKDVYARFSDANRLIESFYYSLNPSEANNWVHLSDKIQSLSSLINFTQLVNFKKADGEFDNAWKSKINKVRNTATHANAIYFTTDIRALQVSTMILITLFECILLRELGFSNEQVHNKIKESRSRTLREIEINYVALEDFMTEINNSNYRSE